MSYTGSFRKGRGRPGRIVALLIVVAPLFTWPGGLAQAVEQNTVYLERNSQGRYLPTIDNRGSRTRLANINSITAPAVSPNRNRVAFSGAVGDESLGRYAIFLVNTTGSGLTQLSAGNHAEFDPVWINGGDALIYSQNRTGSLSPSNCCRLVSHNVTSGETDVLTLNVGAQRPAAAPNGQFVFFDNTAGVWRMRDQGGSATLIGPGGFDATVNDSEGLVAYLRDTGATMHIRRVPVGGGSSSLLYSTSNQIENPVWIGDRIYFVEHAGLGYDGRKSVTLRSISQSGGSARVERSLPIGSVGVTPGRNGDEIFFYRDDGLWRYYDIRPDATLPSPLSAGANYTRNWSAITSVDLDGNGEDEMFFYRDDGLWRYYDIHPDGTIPKPSSAGDNYTRNWTSITAVDLDGDGQDEMFFYRSDGLFRYYDVRTDGTIPKPLRSGDNYTTGWHSIAAIDLDGDGQDEMFFYRQDGLFAYYNVGSSGLLGSPIRSGSNYPTGLAWISAIDLDGDRRDELLLYREDGSYEYRDVSGSARLGNVIRSGSEYTNGWTIITSIKLGPR